MPNQMGLSGRDRISFAKIREVEDLPDLIEIQKKSYEEFLQRDALPDERKNTGLQAVLKEVFPITDFAEVSSLEFVSYLLVIPNMTSLSVNLVGLATWFR